MGINNYLQHLNVIIEDEAYKEILSGVRLSLNVQESLIKINHVSAGWTGVFDDFENSIGVLNKFTNRFTLLLMDFDDKEASTTTSYDKRLLRFHKIVPNNLKGRVFILGVNYKESDDLKKYFQMNLEEVGKLLITDCPSGDLSQWKNTHLECNMSEIERMKKAGIFDWLFI